jgi:IS5 family transposase
MKGKSPNQNQLSFVDQSLAKQLNPKHPLYRLANTIPWDEMEQEFAPLYSHTGRKAHPVRLMTGLLILKQLRNLSDESVVERWVENGYYQYFCGEAYFQWEFPCHPTDLVLFRKRIGEKGIEKILQVSIELHGAKAKEREVLIDTTVQEKNITFPTDTKLYHKIAVRCVAIAQKTSIQLRQSYSRTIKGLLLAQRFRNHPRNFKKANRAARKLKTIAGRLVRDVERKMPANLSGEYAPELALFNQVLEQQRNTKNKIYSLHEPQVYCIGKGKAHKKYEFGAKASIVVTKDSGIIVGAVSHPTNIHDSKTLIDVISQSTELRGVCPEVAICDRGYRGKSKVGETKVLIPKPPGKKATAYQRQKTRLRFRRRAGIEPIIGHLKSDFRLARNFLKGSIGDSINLMLAAAAFNFKKWMRELAAFLFLFFMSVMNCLAVQNLTLRTQK